MYEVSIDQPNLPKGAEVQIHGLGVFKNGDSATVSKEDAERFRSLYSTVDNNGRTVQGPTLAQASKTMYGVTVTKSSGSDDKSTATTEGAATTDNSEKRKGSDS